MKGGNLTRFRRDSKQEGQGLKYILMDILGDTASAGREGLKSSHNPLKAPVNVAGGVKKGFKRGLKRGLEKEIQKQASKRLKDMVENESFHSHLLSSHQTGQIKTTKCG